MSYRMGGIDKETRDRECDLEEMGKNIREERSQEPAKSQEESSFGVSIIWLVLDSGGVRSGDAAKSRFPRRQIRYANRRVALVQYCMQAQPTLGAGTIFALLDPR